MQGFMALTCRLFDLPQAAKNELDASRSTLARGYNSLELGKHSCTPEDGRQDVKESFTLGVERAAGDPRPPSPMHGPNQWPPEALLPGWQAEAEAAFQRLLRVARLLMRALALALLQPESFFTDKCDDPVAQMVMFR
jgi:isopenicillin N synthase-like dioxygenase